MLGSPGAWRKSSRSALHEARTLLGACASISRTRPPVTPTCAVDVPLRPPLNLAEVLAKLATVLDEPRSARSLEEEFGATSSWWPMFFALMSSCSIEIEFTKFVSEEIATARSRHASRRRRVPMPAGPRHRPRCDLHEARTRIVALIVLSRTAKHWRFGSS